MARGPVCVRCHFQTTSIIPLRKSHSLDTDYFGPVRGKPETKMAATATASRGAPYMGVGVPPYRRNTHQGELPTSRSSDQIHLHRRTQPPGHEGGTNYTYSTQTPAHRVPRASVGATNTTGRFNRSVWTKAHSSWTATTTGGSNSISTTNTSTTSDTSYPSTRRPSLPRIKLTDSVAAVAHSGAVGAYIRGLATRRSRSMITCPPRVSTHSPDHHHDPGGEEGKEGSDHMEGGGEKSGGRLEALPPSYHKSPNAAVPNTTDRYMQRTVVPHQAGQKRTERPAGGGGGGEARRAGPTGGGHYYYNNTQQDLHGVLDHQQQALGGTATTTTPGGTGGGRVWGESSRSRLQQGAGGGGESVGEGGYMLGSDHTSTLMVSAPPPPHHSPSYYLSNVSNTSTTSSSSVPYQPLPHPHSRQQAGRHKSKAVPWNRYNQELLQEGPNRGAHHLTPLHTGSRHNGTGSSGPPARFAAATRGSMPQQQYMTQHSGDNRGVSNSNSNNTNFPMIEFRSYTKEPGSTQHRTFTFNLPPEGSIGSTAGVGGFPPGFPSSVSSISPTSVGTVADSTTSSTLLPYHHRLSIDDGDDYDFRNRKGSVSNELAPGFKQLLRTSTPKREREPPEDIKRRRVEFRVESPEVLDVMSKDPVTAISEKLEHNRSPLMGELLTDDGEKRLKKPPKSILKKREKAAHGTGEVKYAKKYQAILVQQGSFKLPSIKDGQTLTLTGRNTKANSGRNTTFSCSSEFAAAFETIDNGDL